MTRFMDNGSGYAMPHAMIFLGLRRALRTQQPIRIRVHYPALNATRDQIVLPLELIYQPEGWRLRCEMQTGAQHAAQSAEKNGEPATFLLEQLLSVAVPTNIVLERNYREDLASN